MTDLAAGYAPIYQMRDLDDPSHEPARAAIDLLLQGPAPVERHRPGAGLNT